MQCRVPSQTYSPAREQNLSKSLALAAALLWVGMVAHPVHAQTFTSLYSFPGGPAGAQPGSGMMTVGSNGWIIGGTQEGGDSSCSFCGVLYTLSPTGTETVLHAFAGSSAEDGAEPNGVVEDASSGVLYGTTSGGGIATDACVNGCGTIFKFQGGKETVLYNFPGSPGPNEPVGQPILDAAGNLFTPTFYGGGEAGQAGPGTLTEFSAAGKAIMLYDFTNPADGSNPNGGFVRDSAGNFYGTTTYGGAGDCNNGFLPGCGVVFKIDTGGNETVLHNFTGGTDGQYPTNLLIDSTGNLYGLAGYNGYGEIFEIDATGNFSVLYSSSFASRFSAIVLGPAGSFYGIAGGVIGACSSNCGIVFQLSPGSGGSWTLTTLHKFNGTDGNLPDSLVLQNNVLYGTTYLGGTSNLGTVFKLTL